MKKKCRNKTCSQKDVLQPIENFYKDNRFPDGRNYECNDCKKERQKKWNQVAKERRDNHFAMYIG